MVKITKKTSWWKEGHANRVHTRDSQILIVKVTQVS